MSIKTITTDDLRRGVDLNVLRVLLPGEHLPQ